jgi:SHS2 domain-containing protein
MGYELRNHTADVAVAADGRTLGDVYAAVADRMAAAQCDDVPAAGGERRAVSVTAEGPEALLFDYLDDLIYQRDVRDVLPVDNAAVVSGPDGAGEGGPAGSPDGAAGSPDGDEWRLSGSYRGVPLSAVVARDLKAVTYSEMELAETGSGWESYVVFDV